LSSWVSFHLPLSSTLGYERGISAVPRDRRRRFRGARRHRIEVVKDLHQWKKLSQGPVRRPVGLNSPATRSSVGFVMREIQTGLHKPEGGIKQRLTKSADNSAPVCFPDCASICLGSRVSFDLPLALRGSFTTGRPDAGTWQWSRTEPLPGRETSETRLHYGVEVVPTEGRKTGPG